MAEKFQYDPNVVYDELSETDVHVAQEYLAPFQKGCIVVLESHLANSDELHNFLASEEVIPDIKKFFEKEHKEIERELMNIVRLFSELKTNFDSGTLEQEARKNYFSFFENQQMEENELAFVQMFHEYSLLRSFNTHVKEAWNFLRKIFEGIPNSSSTKTFLEKVLVLRIYPRIELCHQTNFLLRRMFYLLGMKFGDRGKYFSSVEYGIPALFDENIEKFLDVSEMEEKESTEKKKENNVVGDSSIKSDLFLDARGQHLFNQAESYLLSINEERLEQHKKKIVNCQYAEFQINSNLELGKQHLLRSLTSKKTHDYLIEYEQFCSRYFQHIQRKILIDFYSLDDQEKKVLLYHFTPTYFYQLTLVSMQEDHTGFVHRRRTSRKMIRELPYEYIKFMLLHWWDENIFQQTTKGSRNSQELLYHISKMIFLRWQGERTILRKVKDNIALLRAFQIHDYHTLKPFLESELSTLSYLLFLRFLGHDFIYLEKPSDMFHIRETSQQEME